MTPRTDIYVANDPYMSLEEWAQLIERLRIKHGDNAVLYTDAGYNNVVLCLQAQQDNKDESR